MKKIAVIVPAYNEEKAIKTVVNDIHDISSRYQMQMDVVVVNDCSTDNTKEIVSGLRCVLLNLPINLGIGGAVQTGLKYAYANGYDFAVQIDGDGQHSAEDIPKLLDALNKENADVVIGSRFIDKKGFQSTFIRRMGINYFKFLNKIITGKYIMDSTSGFRLINRKALEITSDYYPDEYPEPEAIVLYSNYNLSIYEVPVLMNERQGGVSSINAFSSVYYMFKVSLAILFTFIRLKK